jgi:hypothetical protein
VTLAQALHHPNWSMGAKVTVDSATLINKGLELIEAMRLYRMPPEKISIVIHRRVVLFIRWWNIVIMPFWLSWVLLICAFPSSTL